MVEKWEIPLGPDEFEFNSFGAGIRERYLLTPMLGVGKIEIDEEERLFTKGLEESQMLEMIVAFDGAEATKNTYIGQINMITVSSFCGPMGRIWGYDLVKAENLYQPPTLGIDGIKSEGRDIKIYSLAPLLEATKRLYGTVDEKRFNLMPGAFVLTATQAKQGSGKGYLYCSLGIGIPADRSREACLLMEDVGRLPEDNDQIRAKLLNRMAKYSAKVGEQQGLKLKEIFTDVKVIEVGEDEMGCALVAAPYAVLAKKALYESSEVMFEMELDEWELAMKEAGYF